MNDSRRMNVPYRNSPPPNRRGAATAYDLSRQQQRAAQYSQYDSYEYDYDTMPAGGSRSRRGMDNAPRSHPPGFQNSSMPGCPDGGGMSAQQRAAASSMMSGTQQLPRLPFTRAAAQFHASLAESKGFYETFLASFNKDIAAIRSYASPRALEPLWMDKIAADITPQIKNAPPPPSQMNFRIVSSRLKQSLYQAVNSGPGPPLPSQDPEQEKGLLRLVKRLKGQHKDIGAMMMEARKSSKAMESLIKEINLLLHILDGARELWDKPMSEFRDFGGGNPYNPWDGDD